MKQQLRISYINLSYFLYENPCPHIFFQNLGLKLTLSTDMFIYLFIFLYFIIFLILKSFFFGLHHAAFGILVPQPGIESITPAEEIQSLNHWTTRQVPMINFFSVVNEKFATHHHIRICVFVCVCVCVCVCMLFRKFKGKPFAWVPLS